MDLFVYYRPCINAIQTLGKQILKYNRDVAISTLLNLKCTPLNVMVWHLIRAHFLPLARSKLRLCSANNTPGYWSNLSCHWPSTAWAYSEQETEIGPMCLDLPKKAPTLIVCCISVSPRKCYWDGVDKDISHAFLQSNYRRTQRVFERFAVDKIRPFNIWKIFDISSEWLQGFWYGCAIGIVSLKQVT